MGSVGRPNDDPNSGRRIMSSLFRRYCYSRNTGRLLLLGIIYLGSMLHAEWKNTYISPVFPKTSESMADVLYTSTHHKQQQQQSETNNNVSNDNNKVYCIGFRRTSCPSSRSNEEEEEEGANGAITPRRLPWLDLSCDDPIPLTASGYCEYSYLNNNGTRLELFHKSCTSFRRAKSATCRMAVDFDNYKRQAHDFVPDPPMTLSTARSSTSNDNAGGIGSNKNHNPQQHHSKGIVMSIYPDVLLSVFSILHLIRYSHNCTLPIELWSVEGELDVALPGSSSFQAGSIGILQIILNLPNVTHCIIPAERDDDDNDDVATDADTGSISGFMTKPYSIFYSRFDQVLWLDADNIPLRDPSYLFDAPDYKTTGSLFFQDYWQPAQSIFLLDEQSLVWELLGVPFRPDFEMESGQLLIDKRQSRSQEALSIVMFLATTFDSRWIGPLALLWGDKDLFRMGWYMTQDNNNGGNDDSSNSGNTRPFSYIKTPPSPIGYTVQSSNAKTFDKLKKKSRGSSTCGVTMVQYDPGGDPLFLHRNSFKLSLEQPETQQLVWEGIYEFTGTDPTTQYRIGSTKDRERHVTCYHPEGETAKFFQERNVGTKYPEIVTVEQQLLQYFQQGKALITALSKEI